MNFNVNHSYKPMEKIVHWEDTWGTFGSWLFGRKWEHVLSRVKSQLNMYVCIFNYFLNFILLERIPENQTFLATGDM